MKRSIRMSGEYPSENFNTDERYNLAYKRVKRIKGFYSHALIYLIVNVALIASDYNPSASLTEGFWNWNTFSTALFWGIGLLAHGMSVFGRDIFFGSNWEEKKIQEFMEKEKSQKWE